MALDVINLLSDEEDENPNKAAKSALQSFLPRKDKKHQQKDGLKGPRVDTGTESPNKATKSVLCSSQPSEKRQHGEGSLSDEHGTQGHKVGSGRLRKASGGLLNPQPMYPNYARYSNFATAGGIDRKRQTAKRKPPSSYNVGPTSGDVHDGGSLAALLLHAQTSVSPLRHDQDSRATSHLKGDIGAVSDDRARRANDYYQKYLSRKAGEGNGAPSSPHARRSSGSKPLENVHSSQLGISKHRLSTTSQTPQTPLETVDLREGNAAIASSDVIDSSTNIRPFKRTRMFGPEHGEKATTFDAAAAFQNNTTSGASNKLPRLSIVGLQNARTSFKKAEVHRKDNSKRQELRHSDEVDKSRRTTEALQQRVDTQNESNADRTSRSSSAKPKKLDDASCRESPDLKQQGTSREVREDPPMASDMTASFANFRGSAIASSHKSFSSPPPPIVQPESDMPSTFGTQYTAEDDALLADLKEVKKLGWEEMVPYFRGRTKASLQVRYSTKVSKRHQQPGKAALSKPQRSGPLIRKGEDSDSAVAQGGPARRQRCKRNNEASAAAGMISWTEVSRQRRVVDDETDTEQSQISFSHKKSNSSAQFEHERAHPTVLPSILRQRELGISSRNWTPVTRSVPTELKEQVYDNVGPLRFHKGTSGDVTCLAWSPNGRHFAAGSIAISDERSMQYNRPGNLILGNHERSVLHELPEHHLPRPPITASDNVNGLHEMRESQDPRLFMTVANVQFSPDGGTLYSAGTDSMARAYDVSGSDKPACSYNLRHAAPLDLLCVSNANVLATASHQSTDGSIGIFRGQQHMLALSPRRADQQTSRAIYPSALRWGLSHHHTNLLLAGFSIDSIDEERDIAGETCLWDVVAERRISVPVTRNVFDVSWNPRPSSTSTVFAIASTPGSQKVTRGTRTVVQCFAPNQGGASRVLEWECPAFDINDVVYCQHDDNLIAAGATDGKVYIWDQRFAGRRPAPLHILEHGDSLNVLDHDRERETADTGIRFLSWGATSTRLYTGSSDGMVKMWNPYMAAENAHIKDIAAFGSAVMSGAFSPDYRDLLIGEDQGRINSLSVGHEEKAVRSMRKYAFVSVPAPALEDDHLAPARELVRSQQIVFRPMGDLPIRQAVQGPRYTGPHLAPSAREMQDAEHCYAAAVIGQSEACAQAAVSATDIAETAVRDADERAVQAQEHYKKLQSRLYDAAQSQRKAEVHQRRLHEAEKERLKLEAALSHALESCKLDCSYLPTNTDGGEVADSLRSEGRIPDLLRFQPSSATALLTPEDAIDAGLTSKCIACAGPAARPKCGPPICHTCQIARRGLTAQCAQCGAHVRPQTDSSIDDNLCERCSFACFRCGKAAVVTRDASYVECRTCHLTWTASVLGYELTAPGGRRPMPDQKQRMSDPSIGEELEFGEDEMERLAARWGRQ